jgi:hypothetical protein
VKVEDIADLARIRHWAARHAYGDERLRDRVVSLLRNSSTVGRIVCATDELAFDALRICAGIRFRVENAAAWAASEVALAA